MKRSFNLAVLASAALMIGALVGAADRVGATRTSQEGHVGAGNPQQIQVVSSSISPEGYCESCDSLHLLLHLPAEDSSASQLQWRHSNGQFVPASIRLEYCRWAGVDCDTVSANLTADGQVEVMTPPGMLPLPVCPSPANFVVKTSATTNSTGSSPQCMPHTGSSTDPCFIDSDWKLAFMRRVAYPDGVKCLWRVGVNHHSDAESLFIQSALGSCASGDSLSLVPARPWEWIYGTTTLSQPNPEYCFKYRFQ